MPWPERHRGLSEVRLFAVVMLLRCEHSPFISWRRLDWRRCNGRRNRTFGG